MVCIDDDLGLTITYFIAEFFFSHITFSMEQSVNSGLFSESFVACDLKI